MFLLFGGDFYYPSGGMKDFHAMFFDIEEASLAYANLATDWKELYRFAGNRFELVLENM